MSRHRDLRNRTYSYDDDDYYDDYDEDEEYYEDEEEYAPKAPSAQQFIWPDDTVKKEQPAEEEQEKTFAELDSIAVSIKHMIGVTVSPQQVREAAKVCGYDVDKLVDKFLNDAVSAPPKKAQVVIVPPSKSGGQKIHTLGGPVPTQGSAFAQGLTASSAQAAAADKAAGVSGFDHQTQIEHQAQQAGIQAFKFDEPSPDDLIGKKKPGARQKPMVGKPSDKKSPHTPPSQQSRSASTGLESATKAMKIDGSQQSGTKKKKGPVIKNHIEHDDGKTLTNMIVIGHVDAGKSTIMGHLLYKMKYVEQKDMHKFTKESKEMGKASFSYAWVMDAHAEERERGVTMDIGVKYLETEHKRVAVLDAPGHRDFIPNMITGAAQADVAILVAPASMGEFESGFRGDGQTQEHALLVRYFGVQQLIVAVNKMDSCAWDKGRFEQVRDPIHTFLTKNGYKAENIKYIPVSGLTGENLTTAIDAKVCDWYKGPSLIGAIDQFNPTQRPAHKPFRMCINDSFKTIATGITVAGKIEAGTITIGDTVLIAPLGETCTIKSITSSSKAVTRARAGENVEIGVTGIEQNKLMSGNVLCDPGAPIPVVERFQARVATLDMMKIPMLKGSKYTMHIQSVDVPVNVVKLISTISNAGQKRKKPRHITRNTTAMVEIETTKPICLEMYETYRPFGRFLLRSRGGTDAAGMVTKIVRVARLASDNSED